MRSWAVAVARNTSAVLTAAMPGTANAPGDVAATTKSKLQTVSLEVSATAERSRADGHPSASLRLTIAIPAKITIMAASSRYPKGSR